MKRLAFSLVALLALCPLASRSRGALPKSVPPSGLQWRPAAPLVPQGQRGALYVFVATDCPVSNSYAPELERLHKQAASQKVACWLVYSDPSVTEKAARKHAHEYGLTYPILLDGSHTLAHRLGATHTPEAVLVAAGAGRKIAYRGRIDDRYVAYGKARAVPTQRDLRDALDAIAAGKAVPHPTTPVVGCYIPDVKS